MRAFVQENCIQDIEVALQQHAEQQTAVANLGCAALRGDSIQSLLEQAVADAFTLLRLDMCAILQDIDGDLRVGASLGWPVEVPRSSAECLERPDAVTIPIVTGDGAVWGVLAAHSLVQRQFSRNDREFLRAITTVLAQAIERQRVDEQRRQLAHEFNNVLMGISPFVEVMRRGKNIETSIEHIARAVKRGRSVTEEILRAQVAEG